MTQNDEEVIAQNDTETTENTEEEVLEVDDEEETVESLRQKLATAEAQKKHWRDKATKKPEKEVNETKSVKTSKTDNSIPQTDLIALIKADIAQEDITEVVEYAKFKGISVAEALKSSAVKAILSENTEMRNVAAATSTGASKRGTSKLSDGDLASKATKGELPDSIEDIQRLQRIRWGK